MQGSGAFEPAPSTKVRSARGQAGLLLWRILGPRALAGRLRESVRAARAFKNWPIVVLRSFLSYVTGPRGDLIVRTRTGLVLHCPNHPLDRWPIFEVMADDAYHLGDLTKLDSFESLTVLDIGAHVGAFALAVARRFPHCTVVCYEPNPRLAPYLRRNVRANGMTERISVEQRAVGAVPGRALLYDAGCASTILPGLRSTSLSATTEVEVVAFEEVMSRLGERVQLVKLDCEGSEYGIVLDTPGVAWRGVERVVLEYEEPVAGRSWPVLRRGLEGLGFEVRWHERRPEEPDIGMAYLVRTTVARSDRGDA
jgi:FkbM family methyltransferase